MIPDFRFRRIRESLIQQGLVILHYRRRIDRSVPYDSRSPPVCYVFLVSPLRAPWVHYKVALTLVEITYPEFGTMLQQWFSPGYGMYRRTPNVKHINQTKVSTVAFKDIMVRNSDGFTVITSRRMGRVRTSFGIDHFHNVVRQVSLGEFSLPGDTFDVSRLNEYNVVFTKCNMRFDHFPTIGLVYVGRAGDVDRPAPIGRDKVDGVRMYPVQWAGLLQSVDNMGYDWEVFWINCDFVIHILNRRLPEDRRWRIPGSVDMVTYDAADHASEREYSKKRDYSSIKHLVHEGDSDPPRFDSEKMLMEWRKRVVRITLPKYARYRHGLSFAVKFRCPKGGNVEVENLATSDVMSIGDWVSSSPRSFFDRHIIDIIRWLNPQTYEGGDYWIGTTEFIKSPERDCVQYAEHIENIMCAFTQFYVRFGLRTLYTCFPPPHDSLRRVSFGDHEKAYVNSYQTFTPIDIVRLPSATKDKLKTELLKCNTEVCIDGCSKCGPGVLRCSISGMMPQSRKDFTLKALAFYCEGHVWNVQVCVRVNSTKMVYVVLPMLVTANIDSDFRGVFRTEVERVFSTGYDPYLLPICNSYQPRNMQMYVSSAVAVSKSENTDDATLGPSGPGIVSSPVVTEFDVSVCDIVWGEPSL